MKAKCSDMSWVCLSICDKLNPEMNALEDFYPAILAGTISSSDCEN